MYYSLNGAYPINGLPERIKLSDGTTRTDSSTFTSQEILDAGFTSIVDPPNIPYGYTLGWDGTNWTTEDTRSLAEAKRFLCADLQREREKRLQSGFTYNAIQIPLNPDFRLELIQNYIFLSQFAPNNTKIQIDVNDTFYSVNAAQLSSVLTEMGTYLKGIQDNFHAIRSQIIAASTNAAVYAIDVTIGWP